MSPEAAVRAGYDEIQHIYFPLVQPFPEAWSGNNGPSRMNFPAERAGALTLEDPAVADFLRFLQTQGTVLDPTIALWEGALLDRPGQRARTYAAIWDLLPLSYRRDALTGGLNATGKRDAQLRASFVFTQAFLRKAHRLGIPIVVGTDGFTGLQLHHDLEVLVEAGIPAAEVLRLATWGSARVMGRSGELGAIAPGQRADLILVDGDPTSDISAIRRIDWVLHDERFLMRQEVLKALGMLPP